MSSPGCSGESLSPRVGSGYGPSSATDCTCGRQCRCVAHKRPEKPCLCCRPSCRLSGSSKSPLELAFSRRHSLEIEDTSQGTSSSLCSLGLTKLVFPEPLPLPPEEEEVQEPKVCHHDVVVLDQDLILVDGDLVEINHNILETEWPPCWGCDAEAHDDWRYSLHEHPYNCRFEPRPRYMLAVWSLRSGALPWRPTDLCCGGNLRSSFFLAHGRWICGGRTMCGYEYVDRWLLLMVERIGRTLRGCWARCRAAVGYPHELD